MTNSTKQQYRTETQINNEDLLVDTVRILSDITRKDIEKSYSLDNTQETEAYYSNRYGWTLRKTIA